MEVSIVKRFCQIQRLVHQKDYKRTNTPRQQERCNTILDIHLYEVLLFHLKKKHVDLRDYRDMPHPIDAKVLTRKVIQLSSVCIKNGTTVSTKRPRNGVWWDCEGRRLFGFVIDILRVPEIDCLSSAQVVIEVTNLVDLKDEAGVDKEWPSILARMQVSVGAVLRGQYQLVDASDIGGQCVYRELPAGKIGNKCALMIWMPIIYASMGVDFDPMESLAMVID
jgi:hypothetical protein